MKRDFLRRKVELAERRNEHRIQKGSEFRLGSIGGAERRHHPATVPHEFHRCIHQFGIAASEPVDRLLYVADPDRPHSDQFSKFEKQSELQRAGVLKFIDEQQIEFGFNHCGNVSVSQQCKRPRLKIAEIEPTACLLASLVKRQCLSRDGKHAANVFRKLNPEPWMLFHPTRNLLSC